jgi:hypothetical protein
MPHAVSAASSRFQPASSSGRASARPRMTTPPRPSASVSMWIAESSAAMTTPQSNDRALVLATGSERVNAVECHC